MSDTLLATDEVVAVAWLKSVPTLDGYAIASTLAAETSWSPKTDGFLQVRVSPLGLLPHPYFPSHSPRIIVSCWARPKKWANAAQLAQKVRAATYEATSSREVSIPPITDHGKTVAVYPTVRVLAVQTLTEPTRVTGETSESLARYDVSMFLEWI
jgi:hypothetical protein